MKKVVSPDMVAHLWAHQSQDEARNQQGNLYFREKTIYSYGSHFPMARHVTTKAGAVVLFTTKTYSNTTSKHLWMVRHAASHLTLLPCDNVMAHSKDEHKANLKAMREEQQSSLTKAATARTRTEQYLSQAETLCAQHTRYREAFGLSLDKPLTISEDWRAQQAKHIEQQKHAAAKQAKIKAKREAERLTMLQAEMAKWKRGEIVHWEIRELPIALRLQGEKIQTSLGAEIPVSHARRLWKRVCTIRQTGQAYQRNGHTEYAGTFAVDEIMQDGTLQAGCHTILFDAMQELATQLGWI